ncbi:hypothetical protein OKW35_002279 [Paraburkholderia sp. MM5477-R1]
MSRTQVQLLKLMHSTRSIDDTPQSKGAVLMRCGTGLSQRRSMGIFQGKSAS